MSLGDAGFWPLLERRVERTPDALFSVDENARTLTFAEYHAEALACAAGLAERGVGRDTAVSWILPTWTESLVIVAALARLGARQNPILPIYRGREVGFVCGQSRAEWVLVPGCSGASTTRQWAARWLPNTPACRSSSSSRGRRFRPAARAPCHL